MDFNDLKQKAETKFEEACDYIEEKTRPHRAWVKDHKKQIVAIGLGLGYAIVKGKATAKGYEKGYKTGVSVGLGENIMRSYDQKVMSRTITRINDAGDDGVTYYDTDTGEEIIVKASKVERLK